MKQEGSNLARVQQYARMSEEELIKKLHISSEGYSDEAVLESRQQSGSNTIVSQNQDSILHCIRRAFVNPFSSILFFIGIITFVADVLLSEDYQRNLTTVLVIFTMLLVSGVVRLIQELRSKKVVDELTRLVHTTVQVLRDGHWIEVDSDQLVVGDQIRLEAGDRVPADIRIMKATDLFVSQAIISGESAVLEKNRGVLTYDATNLAEYSNILFSGTTIIGGSGSGIVYAVGEDTVYGGFHLSEAGARNEFDQGANSIARVLIRFMVILVPIVFIASGLTKGNWLEAFLFALSVAVGLTPELLPMVVNACLAKGSFSMGRKQTVVKNINAMQTFGSMDVLCVDKTGTLTGDTILLEYYMDILGNECQKTLDYAYLASHYHTGVGNHLDSAICKVEQMPGRESYYKELLNKYQKVDEYPFDYSRRFSSVLVQGAKQEEQYLIIKGSIDEVVARCRYAEYAGKIVEIEEDPYASVHAVVDEMLEDGMKVIAVAYRPCFSDSASKENAYINPNKHFHNNNCNWNQNTGYDTESEESFILLGYLAFFDAPKQSASSAVSKLQDLNVNIKVLTGDQTLVTESICRRLDIRSPQIISGSELEQLSEDQLLIAVEKTNIFTELSPKQKVQIVNVLQKNGHKVGFLGDGMNDLPSILQADVGISVENATEAVKESANVILLKKDLNVLEAGILEGRKAFANMSKYIKITASSNFGNICAIVIASVLLPFFPMTSVQLLLLNLLYDILCLILPWDQVDEEMLARPLEWSGRNLREFMTFFGPLSSIFDLVTFGVLFFLICPYVCGGAFATLSMEGRNLFISLFQTGWFLESMWTQVLILQLLRTEKLPFIQSKPGRPVVLVTILGIICYTLLPITFVGSVLGLCNLPAVYFVFLIIDVAMYLLLVTIAKSIYIRKHKKLI